MNAGEETHKIFTYSLQRPGWDVAKPMLTTSVGQFLSGRQPSAQHASVTLVQVTHFIVIGVKLQITFSLEENKKKQHQWRSQSAANARAQHGHTTFEPRFQATSSIQLLAVQKFRIFELPRSILRLL